MERFQSLTASRLVKKAKAVFFPPLPSEMSPYAVQINAAAITHLFEGLSRASAIFILLPGLTMWIMWPHVAHTTIIIWAALAYLEITIGYALFFAVRRKPGSPTHLERWVRLNTWLTLINGCLWGATCIIFHVPENAYIQAYLFILLYALSIGPTLEHSYRIEMYYAWVFPFIGMLLFRLMFLKQDSVLFGAQIGLIAAIVFQISVVKVTRKATYASLLLGFENLALVEQLRTEKEKAETASRDKTRFLASASHDLRQPVHALSLFTHAMRHGLDDPKRLQLVEDMERSIDALNQLLGSLLDISKLDAGIVQEQKSHFELDNLAAVLNTEYALHAEAKGLTFEVHVAPDLVVYSDRALLQTMLRNLISNAIRYTARGNISVQFTRQGDKIEAEVRDTGIGIPPEQHENIFREFYQLDNPERDRAKGLGLGLAIVKRLALLLDLQIALQSQPGQGTRFSIYLPLGEAEKIEKQKSQAAFSAKRDIDGLRVLVIDDELAVREGMKVVLEGWACEVMLASSAEEAVRLLEHQPAPHAIIADYRLREGKNGVQAIQAVRALYRKEIPSLIITGDTAPERLIEAKASGNTLLHKPVQPGKLRAYLRSVQPRQA